MKFLIYAPPYNPFQGGSFALELLKKNISELGGEITDSVDDETVVVYPEIVEGNPLEAKHVVRWLLNSPEVHGATGIFGDNDLVFQYTKLFTIPDKSRITGELRAVDFQMDKFVNENRPNRKGTCHLIRKGHYKELNQHPENSICVDDFGNLGGCEWLANVFNQCETFISYDHATFISVHAALCGCVSIVVPENGLYSIESEEWREKFLFCKYGVAFGFQEREIDYAEQTAAHILIPYLERLEKECITLTGNFITTCKEKFNL